MSIVAFENVWRSYGKVEALRGLDLRLDEPCVFGLVGRNGSGKTTLLRMIPCLLHPTQGQVRVFDRDPWAHQDEIKRRLGYLSEEDNWPPMLRPRDLIEVHAALHARWNRDLERDLLDRFNLDADRRFNALSKGQRRQVGLICAVCHSPELLVLDEPAGGLDPVARRQFLQVVIEQLSGTGSTVLFSSHQFADVERLADRIGILHQGRLLTDEPLTQLQERSCRALLKADNGSLDRLRQHEACIRLELVEDGHLATLRCPPEEAGELVHEQAGGEVRELQRIDLEQLFIDWTEREA
jgi:ABC-2 type transport system ATP-binding protein